jgi:class 3 adenylate cyclase
MGDAQEFDQRLRDKLLRRVLLTAAGVLLALAVATFLIARAMLADEVTDKARVQVELATTRVDGWLHEKAEVVRGLAAREALAPMPDDARRAYFKALAAGYGGVGSVYMGFADGRFLTGSSFVPPPGYDPRQRPWYQLAAQRKGLAFSAPYKDADTGGLVVSIAAPIVKDGAIAGVIGMDITVDDILAKVQRLRVAHGSFAYVVDDHGTVIAHPDATRRMTPVGGDDRALFDRYRATGDHDVALYEPADYVSLSTVGETGWVVILHVPATAVTGPLTTLAYVFIGGILAALVVLALTVSVISSRIVQPLLRLVEGARQVAQGAYDRRVPVESRDEVGYLSQSFNDMAAGLKDREFIKSVFGRYVSPDVMREILDGKIALGGEARVLTIMFSDIRGFTAMSERMEAHALVGMLNQYFTTMDGAISRHHGSINKYLGDGILALFGAPVARESSARDATDAARDMQRQLAAFNEQHGTDLRIGIGVHTGEAVVGNIGSEARTEYTVIGDAVNLASRIESLTPVYGQAILISEETAGRLGDDYLLRIVDRVRVKGKAAPVTLIAPLWKPDVSETEAERVARANAVMQEYLRGDFAAAQAHIAALAAPLDKHLQLIAERCAQCLAQTPPAWDGVWTMTVK